MMLVALTTAAHGCDEPNRRLKAFGDIIAEMDKYEGNDDTVREFCQAAWRAIPLGYRMAAAYQRAPDCLPRRATMNMLYRRLRTMTRDIKRACR